MNRWRVDLTKKTLLGINFAFTQASCEKRFSWNHDLISTAFNFEHFIFQLFYWKEDRFHEKLFEAKWRNLPCPSLVSTIRTSSAFGTWNIELEQYFFNDLLHGYRKQHPHLYYLCSLVQATYLDGKWSPALVKDIAMYDDQLWFTASVQSEYACMTAF